MSTEHAPVWRVSWDPEETTTARNMDPGFVEFSNANDALDRYEQLHAAGRRSARVWFRPGYVIPDFVELPGYP